MKVVALLRFAPAMLPDKLCSVPKPLRGLIELLQYVLHRGVFEHEIKNDLLVYNLTQWHTLFAFLKICFSTRSRFDLASSSLVLCNLVEFLIISVALKKLDSSKIFADCKFLSINFFLSTPRSSFLRTLQCSEYSFVES